MIRIAAAFAAIVVVVQPVLAQGNDAYTRRIRQLDSSANAEWQKPDPAASRRAIALWREALTFAQQNKNDYDEITLSTTIANAWNQEALPDSAIAVLNNAYLKAGLLFDLDHESAFDFYLPVLLEYLKAYPWLARLDLALATLAEVDSVRRKAGDSSTTQVRDGLVGVARSLMVRMGSGARFSEPDSARVAFPVLHTLMAIGRSIEAPGTEAGAAAWLGVGFLALGRADSALHWARVGENRALDIGDTNGFLLALEVREAAHGKLGHGDSSAHFGRRIRQMREAMEQIGVTRIGIPDDSALKAIESQIRIARAHGLRKFELDLMIELAGKYEGLMRLDSAELLLNEALQVARARRLATEEGRILGKLALIRMNRGLADAATETFGLARRRLEESEGVTEYSELLTQFAELQSHRGNHREAISLLRTAYAKRIEHATRFRQDAEAGLRPLHASSLYTNPDTAEVRDQERRWLAVLINGYLGTLTKLGTAYQQAGFTDSAATIFRLAVDGYRKSDSRTGLALALQLIGALRIQESVRLYFGRSGGDKVAAIAQIDSAVTAVREALDVSRQAGSAELEMHSLFLLSQIHQWDMSRSGAEAAAYLDSASAASRRIAGSVQLDATRLAIAERDLLIQDTWLLSLFHALDSVRTAEAALSALAAAERTRSNSLLALLRGRAQESVTASLEAEGAGLGALARRMGAWILSYHVTAERAYMWLLKPDGGLSTSSSWIRADTLAALTRSFREDLAVSGASTGVALSRNLPQLERGAIGAVRRSGVASDAAKQLQTALLASALSTLIPAGSEIIIVPHGPLALLPFAALSIEGDSLPLGVRNSLRFVPSLAVLAELERGKPAGRVTGKHLVVGDPKMPSVADHQGRNIQLNQLPGAAEEATWIASKLNVTPLAASTATESLVRSRVKDAGLIHLATHGFAYSSDARSRDSFVALAPDSRHDGLLTVGEILDDPALKMNADLVVLSACQTGLGDLKRSEGTIGLQRAFLAKGARTLMVSLWSVSDEATALLMRRFYTHWLDDPDKPGKSESLRRAQIDVRKTKGFEHPRYWAAFQLAGAR